MVWRMPTDEPGSVVFPTTYGSSWTGTIEADGEQLTYWYTVGAPDFTPRDIVLFEDDQVWTASGQVAERVQLRDGDVELTGFELPELGMVGVVDGESLNEVDTTASVGGSYTVARLPREAAFARLVDAEEHGSGATVGPVVPTRELASADLALFAWAEGDPGVMWGVQWSADALTWHDQDADDPAEAGVEVGAVPVGGRVVLLDETYVVAADTFGWPQLVDEDGTVFLSVSDEDGPVAGGTVMWREGWWPWSARNYVYFAVGEEPLPAPEEGAAMQDVVTISGPAGVVTLGAVPASGR